MTLEKQDAELFYQLWFPLLDFVNQKYRVCPGMGTIDRSRGVDAAEAKKIADYLWSHTQVLQEYLAQAKLPEEQAQIVAGVGAVQAGKVHYGTAFEKGTVFISEDDQMVYMVKGLFSTWEEMLGKGPVLLDAVLIPFKDMIISDGLVTAYPFCFGHGYSEAFKDIYRKAKEDKTIRFSLSGGEPERRPNKKKGTGTVESYVIKVSLGRSCYRYIQIGKQKTLGALSEAILSAFEFDDDHCHAFFMDDRYWSDLGAYYSDDMDEGFRISYKMPLGRLGLEKGDKFKYLFDFEDELRFQCRVMQELEEKTKYFRVIKVVGDPPAQYPGWDDEEL